MLNQKLLLNYLNSVSPAQLYQMLVDLEPQLSNAQVQAFYKASYDGMQRRKKLLSPNR